MSKDTIHGKKSRKKIGAGGPKHWRPTRASQKADKRAQIQAAILATSGFPTRASVLATGGGDFSPSSIDRHIDLVDAAQVAFNVQLAAEGKPPLPLRKSDRRSDRQDRRLEEERVRSADLSMRLEAAEEKLVGKDARIAELETRVARLEAAEADRRRNRTTLMKPSKDNGTSKDASI